MTFKDKVIYQIYPKSYLDTTGSGVGDLKGIITKLDYLEDLGIDMIWLNPIYPSPQKDNGYDISDYVAINPDFGNMEDFEELVKEGKKRNIGLMLDMVLNHVSTDHEWFQKALAGDKYYQDFFILRDEPTDWISKFGGNAWAPFGDTGKYYLHLFDKTQADLNWRNPHVRDELYKVVKFWMEKGVHGFRFDVINLIGKDEILKNNPENEGKAEYTDKPLTHEYLRALNEATFGHDSESITVGEMSSTTIENCILYTRPDRHELSMTFNFHHLKVDYKDGKKWTKQVFDFEELKNLFHNWGEKMSEGDGWNALFWNNHDQPRALNRFVDVKNFRVKGAMMLAASIHLSRGTPYIYMGEEIGMIDPDFTSMADYVDVESLNAYEEMTASGKSPEEAFEIIQIKSRDNSRTPMQWNQSKNGGFSEGTPWLASGNHPEINLEAEKDGDIFNFYKELIKLRKNHKIISEGSYKKALVDSKEIYAFVRELDGKKLFVANNFSAEKVSLDLPSEFLGGEVLVSNYGVSDLKELKPYQSLAIFSK
ncbi:alpha,alpha-phosphotrehalase [Streptococcaceae bacterium ESL0687]|nr:alpha,alpha-phosphotrehalase [Streptococcaceae bacterium ESL0687]